MGGGSGDTAGLAQPSSVSTINKAAMPHVSLIYRFIKTILTHEALHCNSELLMNYGGKGRALFDKGGFECYHVERKNKEGKGRRC